MIETFYFTDALGSPKAFLAALLIGCVFGFFLERAGFGSSRKLAAVFYFTDMAVIKVMFTSVIIAALGLEYLAALGWIRPENLFFLPTIYGAQIVAGLIFGVGFVMGGWCPGTAAAGMASGKVDAFVFLIGTILGSSLFNEAFSVLKPLYSSGDRGVLFVYDSLHISKGAFIFLLCLAAVLCFWICEYIEKKRSKTSLYLNSPFLKALSTGVLVIAAGLFILPVATTAVQGTPAQVAFEKSLMQDIEQATDHIEPEELADRIVRGDSSITLIDIRPPDEFVSFNIRGSLNVQPSELNAFLNQNGDSGIVVLYSNGMTHPAQVRDSLFRQGFEKVYILTDGLQGFVERCLKPVSLRSEPVRPDMASRINTWRSYFYAKEPITGSQSHTAVQSQVISPRLADTQWLADNIENQNLKIIDLRSQPEYSKAHIPSSLFLSVESLRGNVGGVGSMLLPADMIARHFSLMGIRKTDTAILVYGDKVQDAALAAMAFERVGHKRYVIINGGFNKWMTETRPVNTQLPSVVESGYQAAASPDNFTVDYKFVLSQLNKKNVFIIDVRPADYYSGQKSDEARPGHIPGALNRPYTDDLNKTDKYTILKAAEDLDKAYASIIPSKDSSIIVHCRTGHQGSQTFFVLKQLLGYKNVYWYDAGWSEWAAREELPAEK